MEDVQPTVHRDLPTGISRDISGVEIVDTVRTVENGRFRTFVLVALPTGDANRILKRKDQVRESDNARVRAEKSFGELESNIRKFLLVCVVFSIIMLTTPYFLLPKYFV